MHPVKKYLIKKNQQKRDIYNVKEGNNVRTYKILGDKKRHMMVPRLANKKTWLG